MFLPVAMIHPGMSKSLGIGKGVLVEWYSVSSLTKDTKGTKGCEYTRVELDRSDR